MKNQPVPFASQYKDPRWQKKRLEILTRDGFKCKKCGCIDRQLHVHHSYYENNKMLWEYPDYCYITQCCDCHEEVTLIKRSIKDLISQIERLSLDGSIPFSVGDAFSILYAMVDPLICAEHSLYDVINMVDAFSGESE